MALRTATINVMVGAAIKAGRGLMRDFGEVEQLQVSLKGPSDFVSEADRRSEHILRTELTRARPGFGFLLEEGGAVAGSDATQRWIIDPLDGTSNFLHGLPHFAISIGLEREGEIVAGVVYDPLRNEMFWAEKGAGAYLNERRIRVSARRDLADSLIATGIPFADRSGKDEFLAILRPIMEQTAGVRRWGAAALDLAYVAAGRVDGFWETGLSPWDIAAGLILVREAGGFVTELDGGREMMDSGSVLAANYHLHGPIGNIVREALRRPAGR